jgi:ankyrin repeat protein
MVRLLLAKGANPLARDRNRLTPLHSVAGVVCYTAHDGLKLVKAAELLINAGVAVNAGDEDGDTPLHYAVNESGMVRLLLAKGADPLARNRYGATPLHSAADFVCHTAREGLETVKAAELLINVGAAVNAGDENGDTPLHYAVNRSNEGMARLLIAKGADPLARNRYGRTPFRCASDKSDEKMAALLLEIGARSK